MKIIPLTKGYFAFVDDDWIDEGYKWCYSSGYAVRGVNLNGKHKTIWLHREVMNTPDDMETDHRNNYKLDNRKENLRVCTHGENQHNQVVQPFYSGRLKLSKYKGVTWHKCGKKWEAHIRVDSEKIHLGLFTLETDAAIAYNVAAKKHFGEFALLNVIDN